MAIKGIGGPSSFEGGDLSRIQHTVQQGETTEGIAKQHGIGVDALLSSNPQIKGLAALQPGMILEIDKPPATESSAVAAGFQKADILEPFDSKIAIERSTFNPPSPAARFVPELKIALKPDEFQLNKDGHLLIRNSIFTQLFQQLELFTKAYRPTQPGESLFDAVKTGGDLISAGEDRRYDVAGPLSSGEARRYDVAGPLDPAEARQWKPDGISYGDPHSPAEARLWKPEAVAYGDPHSPAEARLWKPEGVAYGDPHSPLDAVGFKYGVGDSIEFKYSPVPALREQIQSEPLNLELQDVHLSEQGEVVIANDQIAKLFESVLERQNLEPLDVTLSTKPKSE